MYVKFQLKKIICDICCSLLGLLVLKSYCLMKSYLVDIIWHYLTTPSTMVSKLIAVPGLRCSFRNGNLSGKK